jgi:hypothetical protein
MSRGAIPNMDIALQQIKTMGKLWKLTNIVELLDFPTCPPMEVINRITLWLFPIYHHGR